jgi:hypothetical protein
MHGYSLQSSPQQIIPVDIIQIPNIDVSNRIVYSPASTPPSSISPDIHAPSFLTFTFHASTILLHHSPTISSINCLLNFNSIETSIPLTTKNLQTAVHHGSSYARPQRSLLLHSPDRIQGI